MLSPFPPPFRLAGRRCRRGDPAASRAAAWPRWCPAAVGALPVSAGTICAEATGCPLPVGQSWDEASLVAFWWQFLAAASDFLQ